MTELQEIATTVTHSPTEGGPNWLLFVGSSGESPRISPFGEGPPPSGIEDPLGEGDEEDMPPLEGSESDLEPEPQERDGDNSSEDEGGGSITVQAEIHH
ncbi:hypothetical protein HAT2_00688 [Candidatus Similichlamydia laticola]|uniref:Uncharacterized protein n=2 Tax=Candidatus Similichlamydia laticola TaxID=2170265 RepID=A0A369KBB8_9BACT|nr:hypothetical protein HAT2_00688 [Candidatus Similichlamydia laticola]